MIRCGSRSRSLVRCLLADVLWGYSPKIFAESRTVFIPTCTEDVRSPEELRSSTQCNCDCKALTSATCLGLRQHSIKCIHPAQRCVTTCHMIDNIFQIWTATVAQRAGTAQDSGILYMTSPVHTRALTTSGSWRDSRHSSPLWERCTKSTSRLCNTIWVAMITDLMGCSSKSFRVL